MTVAGTQQPANTVIYVINNVNIFQNLKGKPEVDPRRTCAAKHPVL